MSDEEEELISNKLDNVRKQLRRRSHQQRESTFTLKVDSSAKTIAQTRAWLA
jgi:hypothetical protein